MLETSYEIDDLAYEDVENARRSHPAFLASPTWADGDTFTDATAPRSVDSILGHSVDIDEHQDAMRLLLG